MAEKGQKWKKNIKSRETFYAPASHKIFSFSLFCQCGLL